MASAFSGRRVTVVGGSGFIGRTVVQRLAKAGWVVRVATRDPAASAYLKPLGNVGQIVPLRASITDPASLAIAVEGAEAVINLVGILHESGRQSFDAVQAQGPATLAELAAKAGAKNFIQVSAIGADPNSPAAYGRSKAAGEAGVRRVFPAAVILRPSIVFGPGDGFFNRFAAMARFAPALPLIGGGHTKFQPVYVGDVADAVMVALENPDCAGKTYELGGPKVYTFRELMELTLAQIGRKRCLISLPWGIARLQAAVMEKLPAPMLTRDQVAMLERDNVASGPGLKELGITPTAVEAILPTYLDIYRRGGRFARAA